MVLDIKLSLPGSNEIHKDEEPADHHYGKEYKPNHLWSFTRKHHRIHTFGGALAQQFKGGSKTLIAVEAGLFTGNLTEIVIAGFVIIKKPVCSG